MTHLRFHTGWAPQGLVLDVDACDINDFHLGTQARDGMRGLGQFDDFGTELRIIIPLHQIRMISEVVA